MLLGLATQSSQCVSFPMCHLRAVTLPCPRNSDLLKKPEKGDDSRLEKCTLHGQEIKKNPTPLIQSRWLGTFHLFLTIKTVQMSCLASIYGQRERSAASEGQRFKLDLPLLFLQLPGKRGTESCFGVAQRSVLCSWGFLRCAIPSATDHALPYIISGWTARSYTLVLRTQ